MVNGFFREISEEEIMSVNGGCGGGCNPYAAMMIDEEYVEATNKATARVVVSVIAGAVTGGLKGAIVAGVVQIINQ